MIWNEKQKEFVLNDGWVLCQSGSQILGLDPDGTITYGYDADVSDKGRTVKGGGLQYRALTTEDKKEIAIFMVNRWLAFLNSL